MPHSLRTREWVDKEEGGVGMGEGEGLVGSWSATV